VAGGDEVDRASDGLRHDALLRGRLPLVQPARGYRVNVDALWLADFARRSTKDKPARRCLDLGSGVGAVGLALMVMDGARAATLLDIDEGLIDLARRNADRAGLGERVDVVIADLCAPLPSSLVHAFDLVVANPPYGVSGASRPSANERRARARTGSLDTLAAFARAARQALGAAGRACFVFPASDLERLFAALRKTGLEPKRMRLVHPLPNAPARVVLVEAKPARAGGLRVEPPFVAMTAPGTWSEEARRILE
jgi:tRNA1Val (adenine37-N6)-methyltransferase